MISELQKEIEQILKKHSDYEPTFFGDANIVSDIALDIGILFEQLPYSEEPNVKNLNDFLRNAGFVGLAEV